MEDFFKFFGLLRISELYKQNHMNLKSTLLDKSCHFLSDSVSLELQKILNIGNLYAFETMG